MIAVIGDFAGRGARGMPAGGNRGVGVCKQRGV